MYIHERITWPRFQWDPSESGDLLIEVRQMQSRLLGRMDAFGFPICEQATYHILVEDVLKTSEIEGEKLDRAQVRSSLASRLGLDLDAMVKVDRNVEGIVEVTLDATRNFAMPLTKERICSWHAALFPAGRSGMQRIRAGEWRDKNSGAVQVVSGPIGREKIHFEAPSYERLEDEMAAFLHWINLSTEIDLVLQAAIAHFWFITIHPFDDGNGRLARVIADMMLARSEKSPQRFYSMASQIRQERNAYYAILERCQKGTLDITLWIEWFLNCLKRAIAASDDMLKTVLNKSRFWAMHAHEPINDRQRAIINRLLDEVFYGKLTSSKWAKLSHCSADTALRDITDLLTRGILIKEEAGGRSTSYCMPPPKH